MGGSAAPTITSTNNRANNALTSLQQSQAAKNDPAVQAMMGQVGSGKLSIKDALGQIGGLKRQGKQSAHNQSLDDIVNAYNNHANTAGLPKQNLRDLDLRDAAGNKVAAEKDASDEYGDDAVRAAAMDSLATDSVTGGMLASHQVMNNPIYEGLFGKEGLSGKSAANYDKYTNDLETDRNALMGRDDSYGLNDNDLKAYGQASNNIARQYGQQGQSLAHSLASRGLGSSSAPSTEAFSGLMGNQNEQLAQSQMQIAQNRINTAKELAATRTQATLQAQAGASDTAHKMGALGVSAHSNQFANQIAGSEHKFNQNAATAGIGQQQQTLAQNTANSQEAQRQASSLTPKDVIGGTLGGALGGFSGGIGKNLANKIIQ